MKIKLATYKVKTDVGMDGSNDDVEFSEPVLLYQLTRMKSNDKGYTFDEYERFHRIDQRLMESKKTGEIELDEADIDWVLKNLSEVRFPSANRHLVKAYIDLVNKLKSMKSKED